MDGTTLSALVVGDAPVGVIATAKPIPEPPCAGGKAASVRIVQRPDGRWATTIWGSFIRRGWALDGIAVFGRGLTTGIWSHYPSPCIPLPLHDSGFVAWIPACRKATGKKKD